MNINKRSNDDDRTDHIPKPEGTCIEVIIEPASFKLIADTVGYSVKETKYSGEKDSNSFGWWWLGFLCQTIRFILWAVWTGSAPIKAKRAGIGALIGTIVSFVLVVLFYVIMFVLNIVVMQDVIGGPIIHM